MFLSQRILSLELFHLNSVLIISNIKKGVMGFTADKWLNNNLDLLRLWGESFKTKTS